MTNPVVQTRALTRRYGRQEAVSGLDLEVAAGSIHALLGPNGAGKTTTIKMLMNIVEPTSGEARVLGKASSCLGPEEFRRVGYVSENQEQPRWMTVRQLVAYYRPFYPTWDDALCRRLQETFELPAERRLRDLSRGMRMKAALLSSLAYRPELLLLDEPFSGLDPLVRDELVRGVLELTEQERWTVLLCSHDIDEVERLADWISVIDAGRLYLSESLDSLQERFRRIELVLDSGAVAGDAQSVAEPGWLNVEGAGDRVRIIDGAFRDGESEAQVRRRFGAVEHVTIEPLSLREILTALARKFRLGGGGREGGIA